MILAIDQGTTGTTCLVVDSELRPVGRGYCEVRQHFPRPGWVEHRSGGNLGEPCSPPPRPSRPGSNAGQLAAIGVANQRETTVVWERTTGRALARAIVWQDRRTTDRCSDRSRQTEPWIRHAHRPGSSTRTSRARRWLLEQDAGCGHGPGGASSRRHDRLPGFVWRLTGGTAHVTDVTNASRTTLVDLRHRSLGTTSCARCFGVPRAAPAGDVGPGAGTSATRRRRRRLPPRRAADRGLATSRRRCSGRAASRRGREGYLRHGAASSWCNSGGADRATQPGSCRITAAAPAVGGRRGYGRWRAAILSPPARRCSGCATA